MAKKIKNDDWSLTFGGDPELMIMEKATNRIVSSINILKTDKHNPIVLDNKEQIRIYADNVLLEAAFNPCNSKQELINRLRNVFKQTQAHLGDKYSLVLKAAHEFDKADLKPSYGIDPNEIGCNPSYNAWNKSINNPNPFVGGLRTGSCHFHIGNPQLCDFNTRLNLIKLLDVNLGVPFVIIDNDETSPIRRKWYGGASEHRPTNYGAEYRVLSPYVLKSPELVELALDLIDYSVEQLKDNSVKKILKSVDADKVQKAINNCDKGLAQEVLNGIKLPKELYARIQKNYKFGDFYNEWAVN